MGRGSNLGDLEELALLCVRRLGEGADGASVRAELARVAGREVSVSTVYVTLMRLEEKGYARSWMGEPSAERGGKARRLFALRPEGREALEERRAVRERLWREARDPIRGQSGG
ncbi:MAG: PadR family transcriptional regulator [Longimicrobiales bacterium]|nr:PadR family transcriptional regulator [Longimicrobiales bacterium]